MANQDRVKLLVEALRSGKYEQTKNKLAEPLLDGQLKIRYISHKRQWPKFWRKRETVNIAAKYCCLGVACEVAIANGLDLEKFVTSYRIEYGKSHTAGTLPHEVVRWFGFASDDPKLGVTTTRNHISATTANDGLNADFATIADAFESKYINGTDYNFSHFEGHDRDQALHDQLQEDAEVDLQDKDETSNG